MREADEVREMQRLALMNKKDANYGNLDSLIRRLLDIADPQASTQLVDDMTPVCQGIVKEECEVLRRDLSYNPSLNRSL